MDKNETIRALDAYIDALQKKNSIQRDIEKTEKYIGITPDPSFGYSFMRFFWPFLAVFPVVYALILVIVIYVIQVDNRMSAYFFLVALLVVYFAAAVFIAKALRKRASKKLYDEELERYRHEDERKTAKVAELKKELEKYNKIIKENQDMLPVSCRSVDSAKAIRTAIKMGKAETIEDAISM